MGRRRPRRSISQLDAILDVRVATVVRLSSDQAGARWPVRHERFNSAQYAHHSTVKELSCR